MWVQAATCTISSLQRTVTRPWPTEGVAVASQDFFPSPLPPFTATCLLCMHPPRHVLGPQKGSRRRPKHKGSGWEVRSGTRGPASNAGSRKGKCHSTAMSWSSAVLPAVSRFKAKFPKFHSILLAPHQWNAGMECGGEIPREVQCRLGEAQVGDRFGWFAESPCPYWLSPSLHNMGAFLISQDPCGCRWHRLLCLSQSRWSLVASSYSSYCVHPSPWEAFASTIEASVQHFPSPRSTFFNRVHKKKRHELKGNAALTLLSSTNAPHGKVWRRQERRGREKTSSRFTEMHAPLNVPSVHAFWG
jgi:hypothetical protein